MDASPEPYRRALPSARTGAGVFRRIGRQVSKKETTRLWAKYGSCLPYRAPAPRAGTRGRAGFQPLDDSARHGLTAGPRERPAEGPDRLPAGRPAFPGRGARPEAEEVVDRDGEDRP